MSHAVSMPLVFQPTARAVSNAERLKGPLILNISLSYGPYKMLRKSLSFSFPQDDPCLLFSSKWPRKRFSGCQADDLSVVLKA